MHADTTPTRLARTSSSAPRRWTPAALWGAAAAALLASACCAGPLLLLMLGVSGAWIGNLGLLAPLQPLFLLAAVLALAWAARSIWRPVAACDADAVCARPATRRWYRVAFVAVALLVLAAALFPHVAPWFY